MTAEKKPQVGSNLSVFFSGGGIHPSWLSTHEVKARALCPLVLPLLATPFVLRMPLQIPLSLFCSASVDKSCEGGTSGSSANVHYQSPGGESCCNGHSSGPSVSYTL